MASIFLSSSQVQLTRIGTLIDTIPSESMVEVQLPTSKLTIPPASSILVQVSPRCHLKAGSSP